MYRGGRCEIENFLYVETLKGVGSAVLGDKVINGSEGNLRRSKEMTLSGMVKSGTDKKVSGEDKVMVSTVMSFVVT